MIANNLNGRQQATPTLLEKRACDTCRARKVKCDRQKPCSVCAKAGSPCVTTPRSKQRRSRLAARHTNQSQYIVSGFNDAGNVSESPTTPAHSESDQVVPSPINFAQHPRIATDSSVESGLPFRLPDTGCPSADLFEGATSFNAHVSGASDILTGLIQTTSVVEENNALVSALNSIKTYISRSREDERKMDPQSLPKLPTLLHGRNLPLPRLESVLNLLRQCRSSFTIMLSTPLGYLDIDRITELCKDAFFCDSSYPLTSSILLNAHLYYLYQEIASQSPQGPGRAEFESDVKLCRNNLEVGLSLLPMVIPETQDNVLMLLLATTHCIQTTRPCVAYKFISACVTMALTLGMHRSSTYANTPRPKERLLLFWNIYVVDKALSIRQGRASIIRDSDVDLKHPQLGTDVYQKHSYLVLELAIRSAKLQGQMYDQLFCVGADKDRQRAQGILTDLKDIRQQLCERENLEKTLPKPISWSPILEKTIHLLGRSEFVKSNIISTMMYRALDDQPSCLSAARLALDEHLTLTTHCSDVDSFYWTVYLTWTFLQLPCVPFVVIFCNVLLCADATDLQRLDNFTVSLSGHEEAGLDKLLELCRTFCKVAHRYVEMRNASTASNMDANSRVTTDYGGSMMNMPMFSLTGSFGDWYNDQQLLADLLNDDFARAASIGVSDQLTSYVNANH